MGEALELFFDRGNHGRMAMTGIEHGNAAGKIDIAVAFHIPHFGIQCVVYIEARHHPDAARCCGEAALVQRVIIVLNGYCCIHVISFLLGGLREIDPGGLKFGVFFQRVQRLVTAVSGLLVAAEGHGDIVLVVTVDMHGARAQSASHQMRT
jgi:hypothetical protein